MGHENATFAESNAVMETYDADLLVVGMGPAGDVLALLAAQHGLSVIAIDRAAGVCQHPRAAVFDHEVMRIFQNAGVAKSLEPATYPCKAYRFLTADREVLLDFDLTGQNMISGWAENYSLHQPAVEQSLREGLAAAGVNVLQNTSFVALSHDSSGVTATVQDASGTRTIRSRFLVGCDGASSAVREAIGVALDDYQFDEPWLVLDTLIDEPGDLPDCAMQICDPGRPVTYIKMGGKRYRWEFMVKPGEDPVAMAQPETIAALIQPFFPVEKLEIERRAVYRFHGLVAKNWRVGRVLLAGDAAHQMPPFAGQGMCSSVRDAANLAWKLAYVVRGHAVEALLDTYQQEREPHVRAIVETAIAMGRVVCLLDPVAAAERNAGMLARKAAGATDISLAMPDLVGGLLAPTPGAGKLFPQPVDGGKRLDDVLGAGPWLIGGAPFAASSDVACFSLNDPMMKPFAQEIGQWLCAYGAEAVLVRPDRTVFGTGVADGLLSKWKESLLF